MPTLQDLQYFQAMPLHLKVSLTRNRIREWINRYGEDGCYISFSGGKDSTVLLDIVRNVCGYTKVPAVFVDVPTQFPELRDFVKTFDNVEIVKPKISFVEVCERYGFPLISKEVSESVEGARKYLSILMDELEKSDVDHTEIPYYQFFRKVCGIGEYAKTDKGDAIEDISNSEEFAELLNERLKLKSGGSNRRLAIMLGMFTNDKNNPVQSKNKISEKNRSMFSQERYKFLLEAPFEISNKCCTIMKKDPAHNYYKRTGRTPITAQMANESRLRTQKWLENGCNGFDLKIPTSNPMSFWTDQDILLYIKEHNLPICSVYGDVVVDYDKAGIIKGQMDIFDFIDGDKENFGKDETMPLKTTGCKRTGCMLCGFGCHLEKEGEGRFEKLKESHQGMYKLLDIVKNNGVTMREAIDWINEHGDLSIRY